MSASLCLGTLRQQQIAFSSVQRFLNWTAVATQYRLQAPYATRRSLCHSALISAHSTVLKLKLQLIYDRQLVGQSVLVSGAHLGPVTNFSFAMKISSRQLRLWYFVAPSLTRGRICNLLYNCFWALPEQSLLGRSPEELTALFYCLI
jgi:hypothetical protein